MSEALLIGKMQRSHNGACAHSAHNIVIPECFDSLQSATLASMEVKDEDKEDEEMRGEMDETS